VSFDKTHAQRGQLAFTPRCQCAPEGRSRQKLEHAIAQEFEALIGRYLCAPRGECC